MRPSLPTQRDCLIIGIYLSRLTRLSRQVLDRPILGVFPGKSWSSKTYLLGIVRAWLFSGRVLFVSPSQNDKPLKCWINGNKRTTYRNPQTWMICWYLQMIWQIAELSCMVTSENKVCCENIYSVDFTNTVDRSALFMIRYAKYLTETVAIV